MPATLSAIAPVVATAGATAGARLAHAAHVVVPSATCAPHILQKAMENSLRSDPTCPWIDPEHSLQAAFAARYQKASFKAMEILVLGAANIENMHVNAGGINLTH